MPRYLPVLPRLEKHAVSVPETGCKLFLRGQYRGGYGRLMVNGRMKAAHRAAWEATHGPISAGVFVCHRCDRPACVNVEHLFLGTPLDNMRDMIAKGRDRKDPRRGEQNGRAKITREQVSAIRADKRGCDPVAADYGISRAQVKRIRSGKAWNDEPWECAR